MLKNLLILLTLVFASCTTSKSIDNFTQFVHFGDCEIGGSIIDKCLIYDGSENLPKWTCDSLTIVQYMNNNVKDDLLSVVKSGKIAFEIIIFDDGRTCCSSISNLTNCELTLDTYKSSINRMPLWNPIKKDGISTECKISVTLEIRNGKFADN
jgi:hypothetical protein